MKGRKSLLLGLGAAAALAGCRGNISAQPPIKIWDDMDHQPKFRPQSQSSLFADGRAMRPLVDGVVPAGQLREGDDHALDDDTWWKGKNADGSFVQRAPMEVTDAVLRRGQERFNIYCAPCHDRTGAGRGVVVQRGFHLPVNLASDHTRGIPDGEIFEYITNGIRNMPSYGAQIPEADRWKIALWVRVLQKSQYAQVADVPAELRDKIEPEGNK